MKHVGYTDEDLDDLLRFCISASVITRFKRRGDQITLETGAGQLALPTSETILFLLGAMKYRPDLLTDWTIRCRSRGRVDPVRGLAA